MIELHPPNRKNDLTAVFFPCYLIAIGILIVSGFDIFGAAFLESAPGKQNVLFGVLLLFGMLPPNARNSKPTWMIIGYTFAFFMFGGANIVGTGGIILGLLKVAFPVLIVYQAFRLWYYIKDYSKWIMFLPIVALSLIFFLLPIKDENIVQSTMNVVTQLDTANFSSDHGFHILLGSVGIVAGLIEFIIAKKSLSYDVPSTND